MRSSKGQDRSRTCPGGAGKTAGANPDGVQQIWRSMSVKMTDSTGPGGEIASLHTGKSKNSLAWRTSPFSLVTAGRMEELVGAPDPLCPAGVD